MEFISGNVFIRTMEFAKAGDIVPGHAHNFDHVTYVVRGAICIEHMEGDEVRRVVEKRASDGFNWALIKAGVKHRITAIDDNSLCHCIYSHRNPQGEIVQEYDGWETGYV